MTFTGQAGHRATKDEPTLCGETRVFPHTMWVCVRPGHPGSRADQHWFVRDPRDPAYQRR